MTTILKLIIEDDEGKTTVYPLSDGQVSIGRKEGNTIRLMERNVSRRHARLSKNNGALFIEDLDSYNGIRINGERIAGRYEVKEGDLVEIGDYHLALQKSEAKPQKAAAQDDWAQPGTVPDLRLSNNDPTASGRATRDTLIDQPVSDGEAGVDARSGLDQPLPPSQPVGDPTARRDAGKGSNDLPPFPGPGGLASPSGPMYGESSQVTEAVGGPDGKLTAGPPSVASVSRLVCVSTGYAGQDFGLTQPELIIGRVEDNDIVIEHRSVSRNHAKVLFDGRTHKIIDLQSANGILVNGEEYAMTDLRKGDLIELGHVRFRFIPAETPFTPTDEEAREMREAGVEPPAPPPEEPEDLPAPAGALASASSNEDTLSEAEPPLAAYDPSTAATVTDTPLDALGMGDLASPRVDTKPAAGVTPRVSGGDAPGRPSERPTDRPAPSRPKPSVAAYSATVPDSSALDPLPRSQTRTESDIEAVPEDSNKGLVAIISAAVIGVLVLLLVLFSSGGGGGAARQDELQQAFLEKDWQTVKALYEADPAGFADPRSALGLYNKAKEKLGSSRVVDPPSQAAALPRGDATSKSVRREAPKPSGGNSRSASPTPAPEPARGPSPQPEAAAEELPAGDADARAVSTKRAKRKRKPKTKSSSALAADGFRAMSNGDYTTAEKTLKRCLRVDPKSAQCHRTLGVLYAYIDDPQRSLLHYRRYVELKPNAPDAARVREMIRAAEQQGAGR